MTYEEALVDAERRFGSRGGHMLRNGLAARRPDWVVEVANPGAGSVGVQPEALPPSTNPYKQGLRG